MRTCLLFISLFIVITTAARAGSREERALHDLNELQPPATLVIFGATESMMSRGASSQSATRLDHARALLSRRLAALEASKRAFGLITHGEGGCSCDWVNLVAEPSDDKDAAGIMKVLSGISPHYQGSIRGSLERAARFIEKGGSGVRDVLIVTDVAEACRGDPKVAARELRKLDVRVNVIGIDTDVKATAELKAVAAEGGGTFEWHYAVGPGAQEGRHRALATDRKPDAGAQAFIPPSSPAREQDPIPNHAQ